MSSSLRPEPLNKQAYTIRTDCWENHFMQIWERPITALSHTNSLFLVIYEMFFIGLVVQSFYAEYRQLGSCIIPYISAKTKSQLAAACLYRPSLKGECPHNCIQFTSLKDLYSFAFLLLWIQLYVHWSVAIWNFICKFHAVLLWSKFKIDTFAIEYPRDGLLLTHCILNSSGEQNGLLKFLTGVSCSTVCFSILYVGHVELLTGVF